MILRRRTRRVAGQLVSADAGYRFAVPSGYFLKAFCLTAAMATYPITTFAEGPRFSLEARHYISLGFDDADPNQAELVLEPEMEYDFSHRLSATISARLRIDAADNLDPGRPNTSGYSDINGVLEIDDVAILELRDAYIDIDLDTAFLRLGKQQIVWGELEGFRLLDVVNPQNFREFILDDFDDSRIGIWAASAEVSIPGDRFGDWQAHLVWAPDPTVSEIPVAGAVFELRAPRFLFGAEPGILPLGGVRTEAPDNLLGDASYGGRLVGLASGWDLSFVVFSGIDPEPVGMIGATPAGPEVVRTYKRRTVVGGSAATTLGPLTARFEIAAQPDRAFTTQIPGGGLESAEAAQIGTALVLDFRAPFDTFISTQILYDRVIDPPAGLTRPRDDVLTSVFATRDFLSGDLAASVRWLASDGGGDGVISPKLVWALSDSTHISIGADIFYGERTDIFGQFDDQDRVTFSIRKTF